MPARTLAIGDIHGCDTALGLLLPMLALTPDDSVVVLGDVVDRGPGTRRAIELLLDVQKSCRLVFILGNHEEMMLAALRLGGMTRGWLQFGGMETLESYGGDPEQIPEAHLLFLESGLDFWETDSDVFVHANLEPDVPLHAQTHEWLRWIHLTGGERPLASGKRVVCGHTSLKHGRPLIFDGWVCIDTHAYGLKPLTCLDVGSNLVYRASEAGQTEGPLPLADIAVTLP